MIDAAAPLLGDVVEMGPTASRDKAIWRLQLASRLLEQASVSISEAGAKVGYESEAAFNRAFKKYVGVPPGEWRKQRQVASPPQ